MTKTTETATINEFMGKTLNPPITYSFEVVAFGSKSEALENNAWPADADAYVLAKVNAGQKASAKASAYTKAIADVREAYEATDEFKDNDLRKSLRESGLTDDAIIEGVVAKARASRASSK
jgi:hypothetical protein